MNGYLLDSNIILRATAQPDLLPARIRRVITRGTNYLSVVSYWEVVLKSMKGKLKVGDPRLWWRDTLEQLAAMPLPLRPDHIGALVDLPTVHQDPFDRALIAQAQVEALVFVTSDSAILKYATKGLRVLS